MSKAPTTARMQPRASFVVGAVIGLTGGLGTGRYVWQTTGEHVAPHLLRSEIEWWASDVGRREQLVAALGGVPAASAPTPSPTPPAPTQAPPLVHRCPIHGAHAGLRCDGHEALWRCPDDGRIRWATYPQCIATENRLFYVRSSGSPWTTYRPREWYVEHVADWATLLDENDAGSYVPVGEVMYPGW